MVAFKEVPDNKCILFYNTSPKTLVLEYLEGTRKQRTEASGSLCYWEPGEQPAWPPPRAFSWAYLELGRKDEVDRQECLLKLWALLREANLELDGM